LPSGKKNVIIVLEIRRKRSMNEPACEYTLFGLMIPPQMVIIDLNLLKTVKDWNITSSILNIVGAVLLGGTCFGKSMPLIFGSIGGIMIVAGILIEETKFGGLIRSLNKKGIPMEMRYCETIKKESTVNECLQENEVSDTGLEWIFQGSFTVDDSCLTLLRVELEPFYMMKTNVLQS
jgi:hypothetical protein